jgi:hypothetical protein
MQKFGHQKLSLQVFNRAVTWVNPCIEQRSLFSELELRLIRHSGLDNKEGLYMTQLSQGVIEISFEQGILEKEAQSFSQWARMG